MDIGRLVLPWKLDAEAMDGGMGCRTIEDANGDDIMSTHGVDPDEEDKAIALHVITACNVHHKLVAALLAVSVATDEHALFSAQAAAIALLKSEGLVKRNREPRGPLQNMDAGSVYGGDSEATV